jgi:hypothetical protein
MQIFAHDIPGLYAQQVNGLSIKDFTLSWANDLPAFFTHGIWCEQVRGLSITDFAGGANPNAPGAKKLWLKQVEYQK